MMNNASLESFGDASFALINHPTNQPMHVVSWPTITTRLLDTIHHSNIYTSTNGDVGCVLQVVVLSSDEVTICNFLPSTCIDFITR
jgi:hypothetical protein